MDEIEWEVLYHYTSLESFDRIIHSGYLAMSDIIKSNDPAEGVFAVDALKEAYHALRDEDEINVDEYNRFREAFFEFSEDEFCFGRAQQAVFSISFCEPEWCLALWRTYGDNGRGVALGIAKDRLQLIGQRQYFKFAKIEYLDNNIMLDRAKQFWRNHKTDSPEELQDALQKYYVNGYFLKRSENSYEREWRLIYTGLNLRDYSLLPPDVPKEIDGYVRRDDLVLYYKLPINEERVIDYIFTGPQCKITNNEMRLLLKKQGVQYCSVSHDETVMR